MTPEGSQMTNAPAVLRRMPHARAVFLALLALSSLTARAQLVADGAAYTINATSVNLGVTNLTVGTNGPNTTLALVNGGALTNAQGTIGLNGGSTNNVVFVTGPNSAWNNSDSDWLYIGYDGSFNTLFVSGGGRVRNGVGVVGLTPSASNNLAVVTGSGSLWSNAFSLSIGNGSSGNQLLVSEGGTVRNDYGSIAGTSNLVTVTGTGSLWINGNDCSIGDLGVGNQLVVSNAGTVVGMAVSVIGSSSGARSNMVSVVGSGSLWHTGGVRLGADGSENRLLISGGGTVQDVFGEIGYAGLSTNNEAVVAGAGSSWLHSGGLWVGELGSGNRLVISNGGTVLSSYFAYLGYDPASTNNRVTIDGATLCVTNDTGTATLDIRGGTNQFNSGLIDVDQLVMTAPHGAFEFNGGVLNTRSAAVTNGAPFTVGNGTSPATYLMSGDTASTHSFAAGLVISGNAILAGNGTISGPFTVTSGGTLSPGASVGRIIFNNSPTLRGQLMLEVGKSGATPTNDQVQVLGALAYGGSLTVSNLGPGALVAGDRFPLFNAASYSGAFSAVALPSLPAGLTWTNRLLVDGSIAVVNRAAPRIGGLTKSGTNLVFQIAGGPPGGAWNLLASTNAASPLSSWTTVRSGSLDWLGNLTLTNGIGRTEPRRFFRISTP
jgi:T5SS/PEP-CTERM-associated repeat protein